MRFRSFIAEPFLQTILQFLVDLLRVVCYLPTILLWILTIATRQLVFRPELNWLYFVFIAITIIGTLDAWRSRHS